MLCFLLAAADAAAPTFQSLMDPSVFPDVQRGMRVESVTTTPEMVSVVTTGAKLTLTAGGKGVLRQRIGHERDVLRISIDGATAAPEFSRRGDGFAFAQFNAPKLDLRVNGDSLFMFHAHDPVTIHLTRTIHVGFTASYKSNCVVFDEFGGYGLFCSDNGTEFGGNVQDQQTLHYKLPADGVLWIGICPPKPFDWKRSLTDNVVWHWSMQTGYPADSDLIAWSQEANTVLLQSEVMLWKDWNLAFEPRLGADEFSRVRKTLHDHGARFIVYTSPYYFLKDTPIESKAMNSFDHFEQTGFPPGWPSGVNIDQFIDAITKMMTANKPDGLYFDGQYTDNVPALYALARRARSVVGEDGILEWHSTAALGDGLCFLPQADAYVDFILRGEGQEKKYESFNYFRYFVSCYNTSNSIGVLCNNNSNPTAEVVDKLLAVNGRMHTIAGWLADPVVMDVVHTKYRARLTDGLQAEVDRGVEERQLRVAEISEARRAELQALQAPPTWDKPIIDAKADALMTWTPNVSSANTNPFTLREGVLAITAKAHTFAYLTQRLTTPVRGFQFRMKQGSDGGMSWGPGVCVRWGNGAILRVGLRSDGKCQIDLNGEQHLFGAQDPARWTYVRARWLEHFGVVETSDDGEHFRGVWQFEHEGKVLGVAESISAGKVPFSGSAIDNTDPGASGICLVDRVVVY